MKHKQSLCNLLFCFTFILLVNTIRAQVNPFPQVNPWGVYNWTQYEGLTDSNMTKLYKGGPIILRWRDLEPQKGVFNFEPLKKALAGIPVGKFCFLMIYVAPGGQLVIDSNGKHVLDKNNLFIIKDNYATPPWLLTQTDEPGKVDLVACSEKDSPFGNPRSLYFPYYDDSNYKPALENLINNLAAYIKNVLPASERKKILYIQSAEGSTGDGAPYKGEPSAGHAITDARWLEFRKEVWTLYKNALSKYMLTIPILTNDDSNDDASRAWMVTNLPNAIGVKNGMFSHGYQISDAQVRLAKHIDLMKAVTDKGKVFFARGEQDGEYDVNGWSTKNKSQGLYWSSIYATHCKLSMWNVPTSALNGIDDNPTDGINNNIPAVAFFNKYAHQFYPQNAKGAFCAFYRGLDASDTTQFPENLFDRALKKTVTRYEKIVKKFAPFGAVMQDPLAATGGGMQNRQASGFNDAGWKILTTNFERHLSQIEPETTSLAWWNVDGIRKDAPIYGRFARGFTNSATNNKMYFNLDDKFYSSYPVDGHCIRVTITYRALDKGSWNFKCKTKSGELTRNVKNTELNGPIWKTLTFVVNNAILKNEGPKGADFWLENVGGTPCRFHMIEIEKVTNCTTTTARIGLKDGQADKIDDDFDTEANFTINQDYLNNTIKVSSQNKLANISLFDLSGKQIQNHSCNNEEFVVDTNKMSSGVYIIVVTDQYGNHKNDKFIIK